ncbi:MAG: hypothetical protein H6757_02480 [Candidatus Omnitrophica bacterium]|nr:hypothetical protein [Candidatus Omnitrophota bacterium]
MLLKKTAILILLFMTLSLSLTALADESAALSPSPWSKETSYSDKIVGKLGFGLLNFTVGWTALFFELSKTPNPAVGLTKGVFRTISNTAGGALHSVTFPFPFDIPLPGGGVSFEK